MVEPGAINLDVTRAASPYNFYFAPDPSSQAVCTIGGNIAYNSGGAHCLKYGMTSNHVLGIKAVLPDGEVVQLGGESQESDRSGPGRVVRRVRGSLRRGAGGHPAPDAEAGEVPHGAGGLRQPGEGRPGGGAGRGVGPVAGRAGDHGPAGDPGRGGGGACRLSPRRGRAADRRTRRRNRAGGGGVAAARAADPGLGRIPGAGGARRSRPPAHLEGAQERVLCRGPAQPGLSRQRRRGAAGQAG